MKSKIIIRQAKENEIFWINSQYDEVGFKHSSFENEFISIVEVNGIKAGLGRLQKIEDKVCELGGIYVKEDFRGLGLASLIVDFLIKNSNSYNKIFCLPFEHLNSFYKKFGFQVVDNCDYIPQIVKEKHNWCDKTYDNKTLLFVLES